MNTLKHILEKFDGNYSKFSNMIFVFTLSSYLIGFIITNSFFGYYGFVNMELLKTRYIIVGFVFLLFLGLITYLIYGLVLIIRDSREIKLYKALLKMLHYTISQFLLIFMLLGTLVIALSGSIKLVPSGIPNISKDIWIGDWINSSITRIYNALIPLASTFLFFLLLFFLIWYYSKEFKKLSVVKRITSSLTKSAILSSTIVIFLPIILFSFDLIFYITSGEDRSFGASTHFKGIYYFLIGVISVYLMVSSLLLFVFIAFRSKNDAKREENAKEKKEIDKFSNYSGSLLLGMLFIGIMIPLYTFRIFPEIPQQIGGGKLIEVNVKTNIDSLTNHFSKKNCITLLIDRSSTNTYLIVADTSKKITRTYDLPNEGIEFMSFPERHFKKNKN